MKAVSASDCCLMAVKGIEAAWQFGFGQVFGDGVAHASTQGDG